VPRRQFVYGKHLIRGYLSATVAPGGVGKSSLALVEAVAVATGKALLGIATKTRRVWYCNLEDPREEIERRIAAICLHFDLKPEELGDRLYFDGREIEIVLATQNKSGSLRPRFCCARREARRCRGGRNQHTGLFAEAGPLPEIFRRLGSGSLEPSHTNLTKEPP
jgi:hypothetical protein